MQACGSHALATIEAAQNARCQLFFIESRQLRLALGNEHRDTETHISRAHCQTVAPPQRFVAEAARYRFGCDHALLRGIAECLEKGARKSATLRPLYGIQNDEASST